MLKKLSAVPDQPLTHPHSSFTLPPLHQELKEMILPPFAYYLEYGTPRCADVFDPNAEMPRQNRPARLARKKHFNVCVILIRTAIEESLDLAHEIFNRVFLNVSSVLRRSSLRSAVE